MNTYLIPSILLVGLLALGCVITVKLQKSVEHMHQVHKTLITYNKESV